MGFLLLLFYNFFFLGLLFFSPVLQLKEVSFRVKVRTCLFERIEAQRNYFSPLQVVNWLMFGDVGVENQGLQASRETVYMPALLSQMPWW